MSYPRGIVTVFIIILIFIVTSELANGFIKLGSNHLQLKRHASKRDMNRLKQKWIQQPLDHFDSNEKRTLKMLYFERLDLWQPNGPIYIFISFYGWFDKTLIASDESSLICQMAKETNGYLLLSELRYFGESLPDIPKNNVTEYYKFLSSQQMMADVANLIKSVKSDPKYKSSKVVVVGEYITGSLAVWMRELYPDLVDAALAASAPVLAKKDFKEFYESVTYTYGKYGGEKCLNDIETYFKRCEKLLQSSAGIEILKQELHICPSSNFTILENQQWLFFGVLYARLSMVTESANARIIKDVCKRYERRDMFTVDLLRRVTSVPLSPGCIDINFNPVMFIEYPICYYLCSEFGYLPTTTAEKQPFVHWNPLDFDLKFCKGFFKGDVERRIDEGVARANKMFGGKHPNVTKVVFTHGDMDPYHVMGVLQDLGPDAPAIMVNGTSQKAMLYANKYEVKELQKTRKRIKELIKKWIS